MSLIPEPLNICSKIEIEDLPKIFRVDRIETISKFIANKKNELKEGFQEYCDKYNVQTIYLLEYVSLEDFKLNVESLFQVNKKFYEADTKKVFIKTDFEIFIGRLKQFVEALKNEDLIYLDDVRNDKGDYGIEFYSFFKGTSNHVLGLKMVSRNNCAFYEDYLEQMIEFLENGFLDKNFLEELKGFEPKIDLSDSKTNEKIIYLERLGILDHLAKQPPFRTSTNALASVISAFTGIKHSTVQSYINPIINKGAGQNNNPLTSKKAEKVDSALREIGFKPPN